MGAFFTQRQICEILLAHCSSCFAVFLLISFLFLKGLQYFPCLTDQLISCASQHNKKYVFFVIKALFWVISSRAGLQHKGERCIKTHMHTHTEKVWVGHHWLLPMASLHRWLKPVVTERNMRVRTNKHRSASTQTHTHRHTFSKMKMKSAQWCRNTHRRINSFWSTFRRKLVHKKASQTATVVEHALLLSN